jgi:hypothetical protein
MWAPVPPEIAYTQTPGSPFFLAHAGGFTGAAAAGRPEPAVRDVDRRRY